MARNFQIDFVQATDDITDQDNLVYSLYISTEPINNVDDLSSATKLTQQKDATVFTVELEDIDQYITLTVKDEAGNVSLYNTMFVESSTPDVVAPTTAPTGIVITPGNTSASVSFDNVTGASSYEYRINSGVTISVPSNPFDITGLDRGQSYNFEIRAKNSAGTGPWSSIKEFSTNQIAAPTVAPGVSLDSKTRTEIQTSRTSVAEAEGYDVRLNGSTITDIGLTNPYTFIGLAENSTYTIEYRAYNAGGDGPWSSPITVTTDASVTETPTITSVDNLNNPVEVTFTATEFATSYEYRINSGAIINAGSGLSFTVELTELVTYSIEVRGKNQYNAGPWSTAVSFKTDYQAPTISNTTLTETVTETDYTIDFNPATDNDVTLEYFLVEGSLTDLQDPDLIQQLTPVASGTDVNSFTVSKPQGFESQVNVYTQDPAGNVSLYSPVFIDILFASPVFDEANFVNGVNDTDGFFITVARTEAGGPDYEIRINGGSIESMPNTTYKYTQLDPATTYQVEIRSKDGTEVSSWISINVQTDSFTEVEESQTNQFTTA